MSASEELDDLPESVTIGQMIGGLADMALTLNGYTITTFDVVDYPASLFCRKCQREVVTFGDVTALEFLNDVLEHNEANHRDERVPSANGGLIPGLIPTRHRDEIGFTTIGSGHE